jgi:hypothetical protein
MLSVLVSYVEDGGIEPWLKPKTIKFVFVVQNYEISTRTFPDMFLFYLRFTYCFFSVCLFVCACVRVFINLITIAVISIDLFYLKVKYFVNIFQNNGFSAWNFTDRIWILEIW